MTDDLRKIVLAQKGGKALGVPSVCSANAFVLEAALLHASRDSGIICIESTARQVNPEGGYARRTPFEFAHQLRQRANAISLPEGGIMLGGDHLGPGPWRHENADKAMAKARDLVRQCALAGYEKLHLDPTMPCRDDLQSGRPGISLETIAERTADLCETAEATFRELSQKKSLFYVVGAEVPAPGGISAETKEVRVSSDRDLEAMLECMELAFQKKGLERAWQRCIAVVVESGAAFGPDIIHDYDPTKTGRLKTFIEKDPLRVFEAHSTDFQREAALADMVRDHFAILKVGPALTFAAREALFALAQIEKEWLGGRKGATLSRLPEVMGEIMAADPRHWIDHYAGDGNYLVFYGFSDRIRYYWSQSESLRAVSRLFQNLSRWGIPLPLLSQFLPDQFHAVREGRVVCEPAALVRDKILRILDSYARACGNAPAPQ